MTREETKKIVHIILATYPNWKPQNLTDTVDAWYVMLEEFEYKKIAIALKAYVCKDSSGFAPSVGQVLATLRTIEQKATGQEELSEVEAWTLVKKALCNSSYRSVEEFEKLPEIIRKTLGRANTLREWAIADMEASETVIASNFMRSYKAKLKQEKEYNALPLEIKKYLTDCNKKIVMLEELK